MASPVGVIDCHKATGVLCRKYRECVSKACRIFKAHLSIFRLPITIGVAIAGIMVHSNDCERKHKMATREKRRARLKVLLICIVAVWLAGQLFTVVQRQRDQGVTVAAPTPLVAISSAA